MLKIVNLKIKILLNKQNLIVKMKIILKKSMLLGKKRMNEIEIQRFLILMISLRIDLNQKILLLIIRMMLIKYLNKEKFNEKKKKRKN